MAKRKSREESATESFFRPGLDLKKTTEKEVKPEPSREEFLRSATEKEVKSYSPVIEKSMVVEKISNKPEREELIVIEKEGNIKKRKKSRAQKSRKKNRRKKGKNNNCKRRNL